MSRQARIVAILAAFAFVALVALGAMARKYARLIEGRAGRPAGAVPSAPQRP